MHPLSPAILSVAIPLAAQDRAVAGGGKCPVFRRVCPRVRSFEQGRVCTHFHPRKQAWAVCAGGVEDRVDNVLKTLV